jgi:hypothetical protein
VRSDTDVKSRKSSVAMIVPNVGQKDMNILLQVAAVLA